MHSADRVLAEYRHPQVGDGFGYGANRMSVALDMERKMLRGIERRAEGLAAG